MSYSKTPLAQLQRRLDQLTFSSIKVQPDEVLVVHGTLPREDAQRVAGVFRDATVKPLAVVFLPEGTDVKTEPAPNKRTVQLLHALIQGDASPAEREGYLTELVTQHSPASIVAAMLPKPDIVTVLPNAPTGFSLGL